MITGFQDLYGLTLFMIKKKKAPCFIQCLFVLDDLSPMTLSFQDLYGLTLFIIKNNKAPCFIPCIFVFGDL